MAARTSLTPAETAETSTKRRSVCWLTIAAIVVLPVPGRPHSSSDIGWSPSTSWRSGEPGRAQVLLADELVEGARPHPHRERRRGVRVAGQRPAGPAGRGRAGPDASNSPSTSQSAAGVDVAGRQRSGRPDGLVLEVEPGVGVARGRGAGRRSALAPGSGLPWSSTPSSARGDRLGRGAAPSSPAKWQATLWRWPICSSGGSTLAQISCAIGQRVRNRQPDGGLIGLGTSPSSRIRSRRPPMAACFTSGTADSSACV